MKCKKSLHLKILTGLAHSALALLFCLDASANPSLQSPSGQVDFVLFAEKHIPEFFDVFQRYPLETDWEAFLSHHAGLIQALESEPQYGELQKKRAARGFVEMVAEMNFQKVQVDRGGAIALKTRLTRYPESQEAIRRWLTHPTRLTSEIYQRAHRLSKMSSPGLFIGFVKTLPPERQKEVFNLDPAQKLKVLERELPEELTAHGFNPEVFGLKGSLSKGEALKILRQILKDEEELPRYVGVWSLLDSSGPAKKFKTVEEVQAYFKGLSDAQLLPLLEDQFFEKTLTERVQLSGLHWDAKSLAALRAAGRAELLGARVVEEGGGVRKFVIREVPPELGIFRGCVGGDCATRKSPGYPLSPAERVFYFYKGGDSKGYVSGTMLTVKGEEVFYLHTIAGAGLQDADADLIIHAFQAEKAALGVKAIAFPSRTRIESNVFDNVQVQKTLIRWSDRSMRVPLTFEDGAVRAKINEWTASLKLGSSHGMTSYDAIDSNLDGYLYESGMEQTRPGLATVKTSSKKLPVLDVEIPTARPAEAMGAAIRAQLKGSDKVVPFLLKGKGYAEQDLQKNIRLLENWEGWTVDEYKKKVETLLGEVGLKLKQVYGAYPRIEIAARLLSPDAFDSAHRESTLALLGKLDRDPLLYESVSSQIARGRVGLSGASARELLKLAEESRVSRLADWLVIDSKVFGNLSSAEIEKLVARSDRFTVHRVYNRSLPTDVPVCVLRALGIYLP